VRSVIIYGAGSIGNHLAHACRNKDWNVSICDIDSAALKRTQEEIYPSRYGEWDPNIKLFNNSEVPKEKYDLGIIGTPPDTHIKLALDVLESNPPKLLLIEKPLCPPSLKDCETLLTKAKEVGTHVFVAYNHTTTENTKMTEKLLSETILGEVKTLNVQWLEHWGGIFAAHPWLAGPQDSYLGNIERGGGALSEHSHCINIWQHFSHFLGKGRVTEVTATMNIVNDEENKTSYDELSILGLRTEKGLVGNVITDVVSNPPIKSVRLQGDQGHIEWFCNYAPGEDAVLYTSQSLEKEEKRIISKTRPDDFKNEIDVLGDILDGKLAPEKAPTSLEYGLETMLVIAAAHQSAQTKKTITIDYTKGFNLEALNS
jgi:predicted dehydrogenase